MNPAVAAIIGFLAGVAVTLSISTREVKKTMKGVPANDPSPSSDESDACGIDH